MLQRLLFLLFLTVMAKTALGQEPYYAYTLGSPDPHRQELHIQLRLPTYGFASTPLTLASWRPGRYIRQDYAAALSHFDARDPNGKPLKWRKTSENVWEVQHKGHDSLVVSYRWKAQTLDAGSSLLNPELLYVNPINCLLYVTGREDDPALVRFPDVPATWQVASQLQRQPEAKGWVFEAPSFHYLADAPTVFAPAIRRTSFIEADCSFFLSFIGPLQVNETELQQFAFKVQRVVQEQASVFGGLPDDLPTYEFIYFLAPVKFRHAVEHSNSSMYVVPESVGTDARNLNSLMGISSHEFWHVWNVKRLRPANLVPYDYSEPQRTEAHWFTEGVTDYMAELMLAKAGLIAPEDFYRYVSDILTGLANNPASHWENCPHSSTDSWLATSPYRHEDNSISYYNLGSRAGLLLDLRLQVLTQGRKQLTDVFAQMWQAYGTKGYPENGPQLSWLALANHPDAPAWVDRIVEQTAPWNYAQLLEGTGFAVTETPVEAASTLAQLGLVRTQNTPEGLLVLRLQPGSDAFVQTDLMAGDVVLRLNNLDATNPDALVKLVPTGSFEVEYRRNGQRRTTHLKANAQNGLRSLSFAPARPESATRRWLQSALVEERR